MTAPTQATSLVVTEAFTTQPPAKDALFLAHAEPTPDGQYLHITSPVMVEAQIVPPRCRKPRSVFHYAHISAHIPINPDTAQHVMTWENKGFRRSDSSTTHTVVYNHTNSTFFTTHNAFPVYSDTQPLSDLLTNQEGRPYRFGEWPTHSYDGPTTNTYKPTLNILLPSHLTTGAPNPLAWGLSNNYLHAADNLICEPTARTPEETHGPERGIPYFLDFDTDVLPTVVAALTTTVEERIYIDNHLSIACNAPELRYVPRQDSRDRHTEIRITRLRDGATPTDHAPQVNKSFAINPADPAIHTELTTAGTTITCTGPAVHYLPGVTLKEAYTSMDDTLGGLQDTISTHITMPSYDSYKELNFWARNEPAPSTLAQTFSETTWEKQMQILIDSLTSHAGLLAAMEQDFPSVTL